MLKRLLPTYPFLILLGICIGLQSLAWPNTFMLSDDTFDNFSVFYYFYNEWVARHDIAGWMPHQHYGLPSHYWQIFALTPFSYLTMLVGSVVQAHDVMVLYKISVCLELIMLLSGMYLLSQRLFACRWIAFILCLAAMTGIYWHYQFCFNFRLFYLFPFTLYFFIRFFEEDRGIFFWMTALLLLCWMMGSCLYPVFLWFFVFIILGLFFLSAHRGAWRHIFTPTWPNMAVMACVVLLGAMLFYQVKNFLNFVTVVSRGAHGANSLETFLTYGQIRTVADWAEMLLSGQKEDAYPGLLLVGAFVWAVVFVRAKYFYAIAVTTILLIGLSCGGWIAKAIYYFPAMAYYRHIGLIHGLIEILIIMGSGFGLKRLWEDSPRRQLVFLGCLLGVVIVYNMTVVDAAVHGFGSVWWRIMAYGFACAVGLVLHVCNVAPQRLKNILVLLMVCAVVVDLASFEWLKNSRIRRYPDEQKATEVLQTHPLVFQDKREQEPREGRQRRALDLIEHTATGGLKYITAYEFLQFDSCRPKYRSHFQHKAVEEFFATQKQVSQDLFYIIGCQAPKLRLLTNAVWLSSDKAKLLLGKLARPSAGVVLSGASEPEQMRLASSQAAGQVRVVTYSSNTLELDVDIPHPDGAWLAYADAYHPGWKLVIDGKPQTIYQAYLAFKAAYVPPGAHRVVFTYKYGLVTIFAYLIAIISVMFSVGLIYFTVRQLCLTNVSNMIHSK